MNISSTASADYLQPSAHDAFRYADPSAFRPRLVQPSWVLPFRRSETDACYTICSEGFNFRHFGFLLLLLGLPSAIPLIWSVDECTVPPVACALLIAFRFARLHSEHPWIIPRVVLKMLAIYYTSFAALMALDIYISNTGSGTVARDNSLIFYAIYVAAYFIFFIFIFRAEFLLDFAAPKAPAPYTGSAHYEIHVDQLAIGEVHLWEALRFMRLRGNLREASRKLNSSQSGMSAADRASGLEYAEMNIEGAANGVVRAFNTAKAWVETAQSKLAILTLAAQADLETYRFDYDALYNTIRNDLQATKTKSALESLSSSAIAKRQREIFYGGASMVAMTASSGNFVAAAVLGTGAAIANRLHRSAVKRTLKAAEGQLGSQLEAVSADILLLDNVMTLRVMPQYCDIVRVCQTIEGLRQLMALTPDEGLRFDDAMRLAFAVAEARHLVKLSPGD